jgi:hypothetical protein
LNDWPVGPHTCRQARSMWLAGHSAQDENNQYENGIQLVIRTCRVATSVRTIHGRAGVFVAYDLAVRARGRCTCGRLHVAAVHAPLLIMYWLSFLIKIRKQKILVVWNSMGSRYKRAKYMISLGFVGEIQPNHSIVGIRFYGNWIILPCLDMVTGAGEIDVFVDMALAGPHVSSPVVLHFVKKTSTHDQTLTQNQRRRRRPHTNIGSPKVKPLSERAGATCQKWSYNGAVPAFCVYTAWRLGIEKEGGVGFLQKRKKELDYFCK